VEKPNFADWQIKSCGISRGSHAVVQHKVSKQYRSGCAVIGRQLLLSLW